MTDEREQGQREGCRRVTRITRSGNLTMEIVVEGYTAAEAVEILRAMDRDPDTKPWE